MANFTITADSAPVYDDWGWSDHWDCYDWMLWHKALVGKYGADKANTMFITAYQNAGFLADSYNCRTLNSDFIGYAKDNGFYDGLFEGIGGLIVKPIAIGQSALQGTENLVEGATKTANVLKYAVPALFIVASIGLVWFGYDKFIKNSA